MNRLRSYIAFAVLRGVGAALLVLLAINVVVEFVGQLDDVGLAQYGLPQALTYVALRIPRTIVETLPAAALLGSLLSLGNMAVHRELIVMRASGVSHFQLLGAVGAAGLTLMVVMLLLGESLAPSLGAYARELRTEALLDEVNLASGQSAWLKNGDRIINLRQPSAGIDFDGGLFVFELDGDTTLRRVARADSIGIEAPDQWVLRDYAETSFSATGTEARREASVRRDYRLNPDLIGLSTVREDLLDTPALTRYIDYLRANNLDASRYLGAYWSRISNMVSVVFMTMLALPFVFGSLRSAGTGARLIVGLIIGLGYYVFVQLSAETGAVFNLDPVVAAWAPSAILMLLTSVAVLRMR
jgi:lipopolysaccharide export system permease protein